MTDTLTRVRAEIDALLDSLRTDLDLTVAAERQRELAHAAEQLSQDRAVQAAYQQGCADGRDEQRRDVLAMIDLQLQRLPARGATQMVLTTLRRMVEGGEP